MKINVDVTGGKEVADWISRLPDKLDSSLRVSHKIVSKKVIKDAEQIAHKEINDKHQHISGSMFTSVSDNGLTSEIYIDKNNKPAIYMHEGTKDHFVEPKNKKALYWVASGGKRFSKGHKVKGIKRHRFLYRAFNQNRQYIIDTFTDVIKRLK
jgi:hypothetical protein